MRDECQNGESKVEEYLSRGEWLRLAEHLGFSVQGATVIPTSTYRVWGITKELMAPFEELRVLSVEQGFRLLLVQGDGNYGEFRRLATSVARHNVEDATLWWWDRRDIVTAATVSRTTSGRWRMHSVDACRASPESMAVDAWRRQACSRVIAADQCDPGLTMKRHLEEAFDQQRTTRAFFLGFSEALELLQSKLERGPDDEQDRHDLSLAALLRLVFVYFLQRRGMLDGDQAFVLRQLRISCAEEKNYTETVLKPLFFGALNRPEDERDTDAHSLGDLPFLNGGLFEPLPVESQHPHFRWPNSVWCSVIEGLLERYHFATAETLAGDERAAVDPEMLGRVFEGLMYGSSRKDSGSFYTPRDVVRGMVASAIVGHLADQARVEQSVLKDVVAGNGDILSADDRRRIRTALGSIRILDPAVGTGAFLLEALNTLRGIWTAVRPTDETHSPLTEYRRVRDLIHHHLFGVDIQSTAVRLCELRLWLTLLGTLPQLDIRDVPPLPNLSHRVCVGNSLVSPLDLAKIAGGSMKSRERMWAMGDTDRIVTEHREEIRGLQQSWLTSHGAEKIHLSQRMQDAMRDMQIALLEGRRQKLLVKLEPLVSLVESQDLFGDHVELRDDQRAVEAHLRDQLGAVEDAIDDVEAGRSSKLAFSYDAQFGAVLENGGFDVIITNPPWVRANRIDSAIKNVLRGRYRSFASSLWRGAEDIGIRAHFGVQTDLSALFVERSLELLRPGGHLCALVPSKLLRSLHGAGVRRELLQHDLMSIEDHSDADRKMFDATVYPATLHVRKRERESIGLKRSRATTRAPRQRPTASVVELSTWRGSRRRTWHASTDSLPAMGGAPGAPWLIVNRDITTVFETMREASEPLGRVEALQPRRGIFTGSNRLFLVDADAAPAFGREASTWTRPVVRGRDVRAWCADSSDRIIWGYDEAGDIRHDVPDAFAAYFERHRETLQSRSDYRAAAPLWQVYRIKSGVCLPKVVWRDLSPKLEAAYLGAEQVPLNTVYFVPFASEPRARVFEALLNSEPIRAMAFALGERARGGWRRHFSWVMRMLPVPDVVSEAIRSKKSCSTLLTTRQWETLSTGIAEDKQALADSLAATWLGLSSRDLRLLRDWRIDGRLGESREAA